MNYILMLLFLILIPSISISQINYLLKAKSCYIIDSNIYYGEKHLLNCLNNTTTSKEKTEAYKYLVSNYLNNDKLSKAKTQVKEMYELSLKLKDNEMEYVAIGLFGDVEKHSRNYSKALNYYLKSYDLLEKNKSWDYLCKCSIDLIELNRAIANYKDAEVYIKKTFDLFYSHHLKDSTILARLYNRVAAVKNETGDIKLIDSSIIYSKKALLINQRLKNFNGQAITWNELGYSYRHLKRIDSSEISFKRAEAIWISIGAPNFAINAMNNRAGLYGFYYMKSNERIALYYKILELINQYQIDFDIHLVYNGLSEEYFRKNDFINGYKYYKLYHEYYVKKIEKIYFSQIDEIKEKYENVKITKEITQVSSQLNESKKSLQLQKRENKIIYLSLSLLILLLATIGYLFYKNKQANHILKQKNKEKDALVQEIHHRVKNNLQFVSSLINMQMNASHNETEIYSLNDASRRIRSMALVHEMLYNQDEIKGVSIKQYISELTKSINDLINSKNLPIEFNLKIQSVNISIEQATALGMITSELISNSIKYAFDNVEKPIIIISLEYFTNELYIYTVKDNGCGLIKNTDHRNKLGMRLINIFSRQLKGEYSITNNNGLQYEITFNV